MTGAVELVIVERAGQRLGFPAVRVAAIDDLPRELRAAPLQQRLGQPPLDDGERCVGLTVRTGDGADAIVPVAGQVTIQVVAAAELAPLPALFAGAGGVTAVVFADAPVLVLDVDAVVGAILARARLGEEAK